MVKSQNQITDVLILGSGMSGMAVVSELSRAGRRVTVVDKGQGMGGRMATRRIREAVFDHGAQFIAGPKLEVASLSASAAGKILSGHIPLSS